MADLAILGQHLLNGLLIGCAYALIAIGLTMIFGVMNIANFAHGEFYMIGGFATFYLVSLLKVNYFLALPLAVVIVVVLAIIIQQVIFKRLRDALVMTTTLVTIGLSLLLEHLAHLLWGPQPQTIPNPFPTAPMSFAGIYTTPLYLFAMAITAALIVVGHVLIQRTRMGKAMRATFQNKEAAALVGIRIDSIYLYAFGFGAALAAAAGAVLGGFIPVEPTMGGVAASFASLGDINLAEPKALIGFAGPKVIQQTVRVKLPEGFQTSEFLLDHGFIDRIVHRRDLRSQIAQILDYISG